MIELGATSDAWASKLVERLSPRQREVLQLVARGLTNAEIGNALGISAETARTHVAAVLQRLEVTNRTEATVAWLAWEARTDRVAQVIARPAIAVLPVLAQEGEPRAAVIASGIARDLVALFSRWCWFPVTAHAATHDARSLGRTSREIGAALGARFLVDGSLRASSTGWRIDARVVDAETGHCLWADAYDFAREELFAVQDAACQAFVAAAYPHLIATVHAGFRRSRQPGDLAAWELAHQAFARQAARERSANALAQDDFRAAVAREPTLVLGHFGLGLAAYDEILNQWGPIEPALDRLAACAEQCLALAPHMAEGHYLAGRHWQARGEHARGVRPLEDAIGHNPSFAAAHALLAQVLLIAGRTDEGLVRMKHACRLGPRAFVAGLAAAHFVRREYAEALAAAKQALAVNPRYPFALALAAASAWWMEDVARARAHARALQELQPDFSPSLFLRTFGPNVEAVSSIARALEAIAARR